MKLVKLLAILVVCGLFQTAWATEANVKADVVKYEVTISVTYNALTIEEANKVIADSLDRHKTACKVNVSAKKAGNLEAGQIITWGSATPYYSITPN